MNHHTENCCPCRACAVEAETDGIWACDGTVTAGDVNTDTATGAGETGFGLPLAQAYVPPQIYREGFCPAEAMRAGTLFPELASPYPPERGCC